MVAYVQGAKVTTSGTSVTVAFASNTGAGHAIVVAGSINLSSATSAPTAGCTDSQGNTFLHPVSIFNGVSMAAMQSDIFVTANSAAAADTITYTSSVSGTISVAIHEYSGLLKNNATILDPTGFAGTASVAAGTMSETRPARVTNSLTLLFGATSLYAGTGTFAPGTMGSPVAVTVRENVGGKLITQDSIAFTSDASNQTIGTLTPADYSNSLFVALVAPLGYLSPIGVDSQFFTNAGAVLNGGKINTYFAGTSSPTSTYTDYSLGTANSNPIILNSNGRLPASMWQAPGVPIKVVVTDSSNNVLTTVDDISGINDPSATGAPGLGTTFYALTLAEQAAMSNFLVVGPTNFSYPAGSAQRFGVDPSGTYDSTVAMQNWIDCTWAMYYHVDTQGLWNGGDGGSPVLELPPGKYMVSNTMYIPNGVTFRGTGHPAQTINHTRIIMNSTGYTPARTWTANATIPAGAAIQAMASGTLNYYTTMNGGVTGTSVPTWPNIGSVADGTVTWTLGAKCTSGDNRNNPMFMFGRGSQPRVGAGPNGTLTNPEMTTSIQQLEFWYVAITGSFNNPISGARGYAYGDYPDGGVLAFDVDAADFNVVDCVFQNNPASFWCNGVTAGSGSRGDGFSAGNGVGLTFDRCEFDAAAAHVYANNSTLDLRFNDCKLFGAPHVYQSCTGAVVYEGGTMSGNARIDASTVANTFSSFRFNNVYCEQPSNATMVALNSTGVCDISNNSVPIVDGGQTCIVVMSATSGKINNNMITDSGLNASSPGTNFSTYIAAIKLINCTYVDIKGNNISHVTSGSYGGFGILTGGTTSQSNFIDGNSVTAPYSGALYNNVSRYINIASGDILGDNYNLHDGATGKSAGQTRFVAQMSQSLISVPYGAANLVIDALMGNSFSIYVTTATGFTINAPLNPAVGQQLTIWVLNGYGSAMGAIVWTGGVGGYKMAAWTNPASGYNRSITFLYNGTGGYWFEISRTPSDVPNS